MSDAERAAEEHWRLNKIYYMADGEMSASIRAFKAGVKWRDENPPPGRFFVCNVCGKQLGWDLPKEPKANK